MATPSEPAKPDDGVRPYRIISIDTAADGYGGVIRTGCHTYTDIHMTI